MQKTEARPSASPGETKLHFLDYWRVIRVRLGIVVLSFLLVVITAGVTTYFQPRKYRASVTLQLRNPNASYRVFDHDNSEGDGSQNPSFILTQNEILTSREVLNPVVDSQDLQRKWGSGGTPATKENAYFQLRGMISLKPVRSTDLLELAVISTNPQEAKQLVDEVAVSYQNIRRANDRSVTQGGLIDVTAHLEQSRQKGRRSASETCAVSPRSSGAA